MYYTKTQIDGEALEKGDRVIVEGRAGTVVSTRRERRMVVVTLDGETGRFTAQVRPMQTLDRADVEQGS